MKHLQNHIKFWEFIERSLIGHRPCMLLLVVDHVGSSPGRTGFKMAINSVGEIQGSIGGGVMEHKLVELSKKWLAEDQSVVKLTHQIHRAEATTNRSGMICSGEQQVAMVALGIDAQSSLSSLLAALQSNSLIGLRVSPKGLQLTNPTVDKGLSYTSEKEWTYAEILGGQCSLHIVGGGHISLAVSKLAAELGFRVVVYDHREQLHTLDENSYADEVKWVDYHQLKAIIPSGETEYVVIMTVGYRTDKQALRSIMSGHYQYLGMLGSKAKVNALFKELKGEGYTQEQLSKIDAPAGIQISSQTPKEIAVSIVARLIQVRQNSISNL